MYFKFHILLLIILGLVFAKPVAAQPFLNLEGGQVFPTFRFSAKQSNSENTSSDNQTYTRISGSTFSLVFSHVDSIGLFEFGGIGMRKAGSELVYNNTDYIWNLQYVDVKAGIGYQFNKWRIKPYAAAAPYYAYLMDAKQSMGSRKYDLKAIKAVKNYDLGVFLAFGLKAEISKQISIFSEYNYVFGLKNIETTKDQYLYNRGFSVKLGLSLNISKSQNSIEVMPAAPPDLLAVNAPPADSSKKTLLKTEPSINPVSESNTGNVAASGNNTNMAKPKEETVPVVTSPVAAAPVSPSNNNSEAAVIPSNGSNTPVLKQELTPASNLIPVTTPIVSNTAAVVTVNELPLSGNKRPALNQEGVQTENKIPIDPAVSQSNTAAASAVLPSAINKQNELKEGLPPSNANANVSAVSPNVNSSVVPKEKAAEPVVEPNPIPENIVYKIQITAVKVPLRKNNPILKNITGRVEMQRGKDGWIRYYVSSFKRYDEIRAELNKLKSQGSADGGFIVAFKNGKQITIAEAKKSTE